MRRDTTNNHVELWNPMKAEAYFFGRKAQVDKFICIPVGTGYSMDIRMNDPTCQLKSVGCIIGEENIWANVQEYDDPALISFDLSNTKLWCPFITKANFKKYFPDNKGLLKIDTIQPPLLYA